MVIAIIFAIGGSASLIIATIGAVVKWNCRDHFDVEVEEQKTRRLELQLQERQNARAHDLKLLGGSP